MTDDLTPAQEIDLEERIAILVDGGMDEWTAAEKALEELELWWEDLAT